MLYKKIGKRIVFGLLLIILLLQTIPFLGFNPDFEQILSQVIAYVYYIYTLLMYLSLSTLIYVEIENLQEFHFDSYTLVTFILGTIIRPRIGIRGESIFLILIGMIGAFIVLTLILKKPNVPITNLKWVMVGLAVSSIVVFMVSLLAMTFQSTSEYAISFKPAAIFSLFVREFSSAPINEEILMRGFLWGYLRRDGLSESKVFWLQGGLFWLLHIGKVFTPFTFFLFIPLFTILYSKLTLNSKQLFPSVVSHLLVNVASVLVNWAIY